MALNYNLAYWKWEQGGVDWGFDPRITNPAATWEKIARDALTEDEITAEINRLDYKNKREAEYPSVVDQLDDIYHNGIDGWKATIKTTKDKYPKP